VKVFSGEHSHKQSATIIEKPGESYFPPIAALITGGAPAFGNDRTLFDRPGRSVFIL
jgi:hypothetical protein